MIADALDSHEQDDELSEAMALLVRAASSDNYPVELAAISEIPGRARFRLGRAAKTLAWGYAKEGGRSKQEIAELVAAQIVARAMVKGDEFNSILLLIGAAALSAIIQFLVRRFLERWWKEDGAMKLPRALVLLALACWYAAGCGGFAQAAEPAVSFLNIEDFGARANADSTEAIRRAVAAAVEKRVKLIVPGRSYYISGTINIPWCIGFAIEGTGLGDPVDNQHSPQAGVVSALVWTGPRDGRPMVRITGAGVEWHGVNLQGALTEAIDNSPGTVVGMQLDKLRDGIGTGKCEFPHFTVCRLDVGIQVGANEGTSNLDCLNVGNYTAESCRVPFQVNNDQGMGYKFGFVRVRSPKHTTFAQFNAGGNCVIDYGLFITPTTVFDLGDVGHNNGAYTLHGAKFDAQAAKSQIAVMRQGAPVTITARDVSFGGAPVGWPPLVVARGNADVLLERFHKLPLHAVAMISDRRTYPHVTIRDSRPWQLASDNRDLFALEQSEGTYFWQASGNKNYNGVPLRPSANWAVETTLAGER